nr:MAG TPA: hypothetical protein [Caudoviricetes sp.]
MLLSPGFRIDSSGLYSRIFSRLFLCSVLKFSFTLDFNTPTVHNCVKGQNASVFRRSGPQKTQAPGGPGGGMEDST